MNSVPHLELALLRLTLHNLNRRFLRTVGPRYVELDEARAQSAKLRARFYPAAHRESIAAREQARLSALACATAAARPTHDAERFRHLHHELARQYHPDLALDPAHRILCEQLMTEINLAHANNDPEHLEVLHEALTETGDVITQLQHLTRTPLAELHERIDYASRHHHDLLAELASLIRERTLEEKLRTAQSARPTSSSPAPGDLIARALRDLAKLLKQSSTRRLVFPATHSMGQLSIRGEFDIDAAPVLLGPARGSVGVPFGQSVILRLDAACSDLSPLEHLDPDDLNGFIDEWPDFVPLNDEALQPLAHFTRLEELRLGRTEITSRVFDRFLSLHELRVLVLDETEFDDAGMQHLEASVWMQRLDLSFTRVTGDGLRALHNMTALRELSLYGTQLRDDDIGWLERTPDLRNLNLGLTGITNEGARHLSQLPEMEVLHLGGTGVTDSVLDYLADLPKLRDLVLWETAITSAGAQRLRKFKALQYLDLDKTAVTPEALTAFHAARPDVKIPSDLWQET
jgi:hypothetical protein